MATATSDPPSTSSTTGGVADDNDAGQGGDGPGADPQGSSENLPADPPIPAAPATATPPADPAGDKSRSSDPLKAERRKNNQLEKEIRTLRLPLNRVSEINPEEYARLQEGERQKQVFEERRELRERQMEEASAQRVAAVAAERDDGRAQVLQLRKDRRLERAFSQAEGRTGGDQAAR